MISIARASRLVLSSVLIAAASAGCARAEAAQRELRVCADPNNMPFSNDRQEGFENRIANLLARDMNAKVKYTWWAQRRGFVRNTLNTSACDVIMGVPTGFGLSGVTTPYYRSSYVFVTRRDRGVRIASFDDPALRKLRIGVQLVGEDGASTPPVNALSKRGIHGNLKGYLVYGDYRKSNPTASIIDAVARGDVDVAVVWGPIAGYFAKQQSVPLDLVPVSPQIDLPFMPFVFDMSLGVRRTDKAFRDELDSLLQRERPAISAILDEYGVPRVGGASARPAA